MYYSHSLEDQKLDFFITFLNYIIEGNSKYEELVYPAIKDTHELAMGNKNYYTVDRYSYPIIIHLLTRNNSYFKKINPDKLTAKDYSTIKDIASEQRDLLVIQ